MKKALIVTTVSGFVPQFEMNNVKILQNLGYEVHYASNYNNPHYGCDNKRLDGTNIIKHQIDFIRTPFNLIKNRKAYRQLKKVVEQEKPKLIHCHTPMGGVLARLVGAKYRKHGLKVIYTAHGFHFYKGAPIINWLLYYPIERMLAHITDVLITINKEDYKIAKKFRSGALEYVPGVGIDIEAHQRMECDQEKIRHKLGISSKDIVILSVGELSKRKNHQVVIKAIAKCKEENQNMKYLIAGEGKERNHLEKLIKRNQLESVVKLLGFQKDIKDILCITDYFIFPSLQEGLPVALLEAVALGIPCIASNIRGNRELLFNIHNSVLAKSDKDYVAYIKKILNNPKITHESCEHINQTIYNNYSLQNVGNKMREIYTKRPRVLHVLYSNRYGGAEKIVLEMMRELEKNYENIYLSPRGSICAKVDERQANAYFINHFTWMELKKAINNLKPDIIHAHDYSASILCALISHGKYCLISHLHHNSEECNRWGKKALLYRLAERYIDKIVVVSESVVKKTVYYTSIKAKLEVAENPTHISYIRKQASIRKEEPSDLVFVGRLSEEKDPLRFINIVDEITKKNPAITATIVGNGALEQVCVQLIQEKDLQKNIKMVGFQENPYPYIKNAKIFCMTSKEEGYGLAVMEAIVLDIPVLVSDTGHMTEIFEEELCRTNRDYIQKIEKLLFDKEVYRKWRDRMRHYRNHITDVITYKEKINRIYQELINGE